jgi:hypothetical protein
MGEHKRKHKHESDTASSSKKSKKEHKKKRKDESKTRIVDDDPNDEDLWVEKNIDMDGERVSFFTSSL